MVCFLLCMNFFCLWDNKYLRLILNKHPSQSARTLTIKTPKDHQSALWVWPRLLTTSGAMYSMVPQNEYARLSWSIASLLRPKSKRAEKILNHQHMTPLFDGKNVELDRVAKANEQNSAHLWSLCGLLHQGECWEGEATVNYISFLHYYIESS